MIRPTSLSTSKPFPRKGYRFVAPVSHPADTQNGGASSQSTARDPSWLYQTLGNRAMAALRFRSITPDEKQDRRRLLSRKVAVLIAISRVSDWNRRAHSIYISSIRPSSI